MALTSENGNDMVMPVQPMYGNGGGGWGNSFGGDWGWIILLLLIAGGGWGFGGNRGGFGGGYGAVDGAALYPWMNQSEVTTQGFQNAALSGQLNGIQTGVNNLATQLCNCCGDMQMAVSNGFAQAEIANNARQMADMQQMFGIQSALQNCCCENRANIADLKYTVATENCADRAALSDGIRDLLAATQAQTQTILTQLCNDKIEAKNDIISQLRQELLYARGQASQDVQTARILAGQTSEVDALYDRLNNCPVSTVPVYGRQPIFTCSNNGCGCGGTL